MTREELIQAANDGTWLVAEKRLVQVMHLYKLYSTVMCRDTQGKYCTFAPLQLKPATPNDMLKYGN